MLGMISISTITAGKTITTTATVATNCIQMHTQMYKLTNSDKADETCNYVVPLISPIAGREWLKFKTMMLNSCTIINQYIKQYAQSKT